MKNSNQFKPIQTNSNQKIHFPPLCTAIAQFARKPRIFPTPLLRGRRGSAVSSFLAIGYSHAHKRRTTNRALATTDIPPFAASHVWFSLQADKKSWELATGDEEPNNNERTIERTQDSQDVLSVVVGVLQVLSGI